MIGRQLLTSIFKHLNLILVYLLVLAHDEKCLLKKLPFIKPKHKGSHSMYSSLQAHRQSWRTGLSESVPSQKRFPVSTYWGTEVIWLRNGKSKAGIGNAAVSSMWTLRCRSESCLTRTFLVVTKGAELPVTHIKTVLCSAAASHSSIPVKVLLFQMAS